MTSFVVKRACISFTRAFFRQTLPVRYCSMASKKSRKVHVTFGDSKRIMSYQQGTEVQELRSHFLSVFSDVLADDISPANVKFQVFDKTFKDYVDLGNDLRLDENAQIKAITIATKEKQVNCYADAHCASWWRYQCVIPMYLVTDSEPRPPRPPSDFKFHPINQDVSYRFWNPVSNGLMQRVDQKVTCSGGFFSRNPDTMIQAKSVGDNLFHLVYNGEGPTDSFLYITSGNEGEQVTVKPTPTQDSVFVPDYYWGQTMFRSRDNSKLYLGCDVDKNATLVTMEDPHYPNPAALFIVNKYNPIKPI